MLKLSRFLKRSSLTILFAVLLLIVKVGTDLSLPFFTSRIVNIGIQQSGIESFIPPSLSEQTFTMFLEKGEQSTTEALRTSYVYDEQHHVFHLQSNYTVDESMMLALISGQGGDLEDNLEKQQAIGFLTQEYEALGINIASTQMKYISKMGLFMLLVSLVGMVASIFVSFFASRTAARLGSDLRSALFSKTLSFSQHEMSNFSTASLITRSTNDVQQIQRSFVMFLRIVVFAPLMALGGFFQVLQTNSSISWIIGLAVVCIFTIVITLFSFTMPRFKRLQLLIDDINRIVRETLSGLQVIRAFNNQDHERKRFKKANDELTKTSLFVNRAMGAMMPLMMLVMNFTMILIVFQSSRQIAAGHMQVGDMMAFMQYSMLIIMSFLMMTMLTIMLPRAAISANRINEVLDTPITITSIDSPKDLVSTQGELEFHDLSFRFPNAEAPTLCNISFKAQRGTTTAIIGSTGSGKSTLLNLILRFYDPSQGSITLDGIDLRTLDLTTLRSHIGFVPQQGLLLSGTINSNIAFGKEVSQEDVTQAAKIADAHNFTMERTDQYDSFVSQKGANLSGGQRQRVSIARALASHPQILLFDDSFSALDYKTELKVRTQLYDHHKDATILVVSQRVSSIMHADQILVLDEGRLVGKGRHKELMHTCEVYQQIAQSQLSAEEITA